jgi:hypothetical protein
LTYDLVAYTDQRHFRSATPAVNDLTLPLPGLSPVSGRRLDVRFDGGMLSSDGRILLLREVEQRLGVADRLAACIKDPRSPERKRFVDPEPAQRACLLPEDHGT